MLGKVNSINCWHPQNPVDNGTPDSAVPEELDYDMWLGPAAWRPYNRNRVHFNFRWILDLGGGYIRDRGAHVFSQALWFMNADKTGPVSVDATGVAPSHGVFDTPVKMNIKYQFKNPDWTLHWSQPGKKAEGYKGDNFGFEMWGEKDTTCGLRAETAAATPRRKLCATKFPPAARLCFTAPATCRTGTTASRRARIR